VVGGDVAADGTAFARIAGVGRCERHGQDASCNFSHHQPVGGRFGRANQRVAGPDVADVVQAQTWMLEQVAGLLVDSKGQFSSRSSTLNRVTPTLYYKQVRMTTAVFGSGSMIGMRAAIRW